MTATYDLMLMLDLVATSDQHAKTIKEIEAAVAKDGGSLDSNQDWGERPLTYEIDHKDRAHYHLIRLTGQPSLAATLERSLRIDDAVLRFRIIKSDGTEAPPAPPSASFESASATTPVAEVTESTEPAPVVVEEAVVVEEQVVVVEEAAVPAEPTTDSEPATEAADSDSTESSRCP